MGNPASLFAALKAALLVIFSEICVTCSTVLPALRAFNPDATPPGIYGRTVAAASSIIPTPSKAAAPYLPLFILLVKFATPNRTLAASQIVSKGIFPSGSFKRIGLLLQPVGGINLS